MDSNRNTPASGISSHKKKAAGVRTWLLIDNTGNAHVVEEGRQSTMHWSGLTARDLRILDPLLSYPTRILGREKAILINLEHIKAVITANEILLLNFTNPCVSKFVEDLQIRLLRFHNATTIQEGSISSNETQSGDLICESDHEDLMRSRIDQGPTKYSLGFQNGHMVLPFEFIVLEACLEAACSSLHDEATTLEGEAYPALDKLASKISTLNLEHVREIKSRLVMIFGRVQKVRLELENLLDDDEDMAEMYLTNNWINKQLDGSFMSSASSQQSEEIDIAQEKFQSHMDDGISKISLEENVIPNSYERNVDSQFDLLAGQNSFIRDSNRSNTSITSSAISKQLNVEEMEMLLEAFFVQIDGTLNKLSTLKEYVDDTEDYVNMMLDDKQNQLLKFGVMLATGTLILNALCCLFNTFGIEIKTELSKDINGSAGPEFWLVAAAGTVGSIVMYLLAIAWCKHKGLI